MKIKELRIKHGFTQKELSEYTGIPKRTIENWEGGQRSCPAYVENLLEFFLENSSKPIEKVNYYMNIKEMRARHGFTQKGLSEYTGIPQRTIENWEGGKNSCPAYVGKLIEFFLANSQKTIDNPLNE